MHSCVANSEHTVYVVNTDNKQTTAALANESIPGFVQEVDTICSG